MRKMRNFKTLTAVALAATMVMGSAMNVMAVSGDAVESEGSYEGGAMKYPRLSVTLPTVAKADYDYIADPNNLIKDTVTASGDAARYKDSQFTGTSGIYFLTTPKDETNPKNIYSEKSAAKTVTNNNAQDIFVRVKLEQGSVAGDTDVTYAPSDTFTTKNKEIYLAVTDDTTTAALSSTAAAVVQKQVNGTKSNYKKAYDEDTDSYGYQLKDAADLADWQECSFYLTGALNTDPDVKWGDNVKFPSIQVTWAYNAVDPADEPELDEYPTTTNFTYSLAAGGNLIIPCDLVAANATEIADFAMKGAPNGWDYSVNGTWSCPTIEELQISGNAITVTQNMLSWYGKGQYECLIVFSDSNIQTITITVTD